MGSCNNDTEYGLGLFGRYTADRHAGRQRPGRKGRELGIAPGVLSPGAHNAITDVDGVRVGHVTLMEGDHIRTGATAILPHGDNLYQNKVPAAVVIGNGFGKMMGISQILELGEIETPIVLTNTLNVPEAANAIIGWTLSQPGNEDVGSVNAIVGETNDGHLNDIRGRHVTPEMVVEAIESAKAGPVAEGAVGAGTGTVAFGWKGGIGTSSRKLPARSVVTRWVCWCSRTTAASCRWTAFLLGKSLISFTCKTMWQTTGRWLDHDHRRDRRPAL
nr:P1 family peptidase [Kordiimonas gwangyangensis]